MKGWMKKCGVMVMVAMLMSIAACEHSPYRPRPWGIGDAPPGPPEFRKGWEDGCDTGIGAYGNDFYKVFYTYKQDLNLIQNPVYYRAWKDAYTYCRWYTEQWAKPWN